MLVIKINTLVSVYVWPRTIQYVTLVVTISLPFDTCVMNDIQDSFSILLGRQSEGGGALGSCKPPEFSVDKFDFERIKKNDHICYYVQVISVGGGGVGSP